LDGTGQKNFSQLEMDGGSIQRSRASAGESDVTKCRAPLGSGIMVVIMLKARTKDTCHKKISVFRDGSKQSREGKRRRTRQVNKKQRNHHVQLQMKRHSDFTEPEIRNNSRWLPVGARKKRKEEQSRSPQKSVGGDEKKRGQRITAGNGNNSNSKNDMSAGQRNCTIVDRNGGAAPTGS